MAAVLVAAGAVAACQGGRSQPSPAAAPSAPGALDAFPSTALPRPLLPQSAALLFGSEMLFRWDGAGAPAELSRTRDFSSIAQTTAAGVTEAVLQVAPGIWFWRVANSAGQVSAVWAFEVMPGIAAGHARGVLLCADFNGDMRADLTVQYGVLLGGTQAPLADALLTLDPGALKIPELVRAADDGAYLWATAEPAGDIDGDGFGDMTAQVVRRAARMDQRVAVRLLFKGAAQIPSHWAATARAVHQAQRIGDVNEDGYADVLECPRTTPTARCAVYAGSAQGLSALPLLDLPAFQYVLGGSDLDGDDHADLVGVTLDGRVTLYRGPLGASSPQAARSWVLPRTPILQSALGDVDGDGLIDIWGTAISDQSEVTVWEIPGKDALTTSAPRFLGTVNLELAKAFAFVPGVGPKKSGLLAFSTGGFPSTAFAQTQLPFRLEAARRSAPLTDTRGDGISSVNALESVGDFNGDGWADLLVTRSTDAEDVTSEVYFGGGRPFAIRAKDSGFTSGGAVEFNFQ